MVALFASGHAANLVILVMAIEAIWLASLTRLRLASIMAALLPGALMVSALRAALVGAPWPWIAVPLILAWPVHLWDIKVRLARTR